MRHSSAGQCVAATVLVPLACVAALLMRPASADAGCNLIPGTAKTFNAALGATNRPFAAPGEGVEIRTRPCDASSPGLSPNAADHEVTVVFQPASGPRHAVVLTAAADCAAVTPRLAACAAQLTGGGTATCVAGANAGMQIVDRNGVPTLHFLFPDTDAQFAPDGDDRTLAGPAAIAVSPAGAPLPCGLATASCAAQSGLIACVDNYYANDGACGTAVPLGAFAHFTALPPPNSYQADCFNESPPCTAGAGELRVALDTAGNILMPVGWQGVLVPGRVPIPRLLHARLRSPIPVAVPGQVFLGSFTPEGGQLPPIFEPQLDPTVSDPDVVTLFGSVDAPYTILRFAHRHGTCVGGANADQRCSLDEDCPGGACATSCVANPAKLCTSDAQCPSGSCGTLYDSTLLSAVAGAGPVVLPRPFAGTGLCQVSANQCMATNDPVCTAGGSDICVAYAFEAQSPVTLDSLATQTQAVRSFTISEAIDGRDRNGDGDLDDFVVTLHDRSTGAGNPLGAPSGCGIAGTPEGRAVISVSQPPFRFPAVAVENDTLAFLESEEDAKRCDANGDSDTADAILRVFKLSGGEVAVSPRAVDTEPRIDGRPLAVSNGRVFVRTSEAAMAERQTELVRAGTDVGGFGSMLPWISPNGRYVAARPRSGGLGDLRVYDRVTATGHLVISGNNYMDWPYSFSATGRFLAFSTNSSNLLGPGGDTNASFDVFVLDRDTDDDGVFDEPGATAIERVSVGPGGAEAAASSQGARWPSISADGRYVAFSSDATDLIGAGADTNAAIDVFVHDRQTHTTVRMSVDANGNELATGGLYPSLSANGRFVAFESLGVVSYVHDRDTDADGIFDEPGATTTELITVGAGGGQSYGTAPAISADGRFVAFLSGAADLLGPGVDTNGATDVYVRDRLLGITERVSVGPNGLQQDSTPSSNFLPSISADGRFVVFPSDATNLLGPGNDTNGVADVFVHDRVSGTTERVSVGPGGAEITSPATGARYSSVSADGRVVAFESDSPDLLGPGGDPNLYSDTFIHALDPADPNGVDAQLFPNGVLDDTVLEAVDAGSGMRSTLCPAGDVTVAGGNAAFLRPESAAGTAACPGGSLNPPDTDLTDEVVQLWTGGAVQNLGRAATAVALSATQVAALVSEAGDGAIYNGDGDMNDTVAQVHAVGGGAWTNTGQAADRIAINGNLVAFITPEAAQGAASINADGDATDRVLQVFDAAGPGQLVLSAASTPRAMAADDFVIGDRAASACGDVQLIAFRTSEAAEGNQNLNAVSNGQPTTDADTNDDVLQIYDAVSGTLVNTGQAVVPCELEACDPRLPYRIIGSKVKFLTYEPDQGVNQDLSGEGSTTDLVLQVFDFCTTRSTPIARVLPDTAAQTGGTSHDPLSEPEQSAVLPTDAGRCDAGPCTQNPDTCGTGAFCEADTCDPGLGKCRRHSSLSCANDAACARCILQQPATCLSNGDCPAGSSCGAQVVVAVAAVVDTDDDGVPDAQDNCPFTFNTDQADRDGDGAGDACDAEFVSPLAGGKLQLSDPPGDPTKRKLALISKDDAVAPPAADGGAPPTAVGGSLQLFNPTTMKTATWTLPAADWTGVGNPPGSKGYKYKRANPADGPCKKALLKPGKLLKLLCQGTLLDFDLADSPQGSLAALITVGSRKQCVLFDAPGEDTSATFKASNSGAPATCPTAP